MKRRRPQSTNFKPRKRANVSVYAPRAPATYRRKAIIRVPEYKVTDYVFEGTCCAAATGTALYSVCANLSRGDGVLDNFDGGKIFPVGLQIKGRFYFNPASVQIAATCRVVVFQWYDDTAPVLNAAAASAIFQYNASNGALVNSPTSLTNRENIRVLMDKTVNLVPPTLVGGSSIDIISFKKYIKGNRMTEVCFQSGAATIQKGNIYVVATYDPGAAAAGTNAPAFHATTRLTFLD